jgi:Flp pilus assembly protein TadB
MQFDPQHPKLPHRGGLASRAQGLLARVLAAVTAAAVLIGAVAVSIAVFAVALTAIFAFGIYFWWKLRQARRQVSTRFAQGDVLEGVVVREVRTDRRSRPES